MAKAQKYSVPAMEKGLDLIEAMAGSPVALSLSELGRDLGKGSSELFRMLNCLESRGYVAREAGSGKYALTLRLFQLAHTHSPVDQLLAAAGEPMRRLTQALRESCHLSVMHEDRLVVIAQEESPDKVRLSMEVGASFDPATTASGRLLMAQGRPRPPEHVKARDETLMGVSDIAHRIGGAKRAVLAALTVSRLYGRRGAGSDAMILRLLKRAANEIETKLGIDK